MNLEIAKEELTIKILAELVQDKRKQVIGIFDSEESLKEFLHQIPFVDYEIDQLDDVQFEYYSLKYAKSLNITKWCIRDLHS